LPQGVVSGNGTEFTSGEVLGWTTGRLQWHYIEPGKPVQNAFVESFFSKLRDECLNGALIPHARRGAQDHRDVVAINNGRTPASDPVSGNLRT
jgi:putative transposase